MLHCQGRHVELKTLLWSNVNTFYEPFCLNTFIKCSAISNLRNILNTNIYASLRSRGVMKKQLCLIVVEKIY